MQTAAPTFYLAADMHSYGKQVWATREGMAL